MYPCQCSFRPQVVSPGLAPDPQIGHLVLQDPQVRELGARPDQPGRPSMRPSAANNRGLPPAAPKERRPCSAGCVSTL